jgi:hypothetical protein
VARYHAHKTTRDRYEDCAKQLVLPEGADSITVWVRFTSKRKGDAVAINNVKLEDLGRQQPASTSQPRASATQPSASTTQPASP